MQNPDFERTLSLLREDDSEKLEALWSEADAVRFANVGNEVHLRGLIELSNRCHRSCGYCGIRAGNSKITRYRLSTEEVLECAKTAVRFGYGSIVMQAGEDSGISAVWIGELVSEIKSRYDLAITLSLGERNEADWALWKNAGADRYLLRFETSNRELFSRIHPPVHGCPEGDRIAMLHRLREIGYEIGSGVMVGIPGQSYTDLANDIVLFSELDLDMIGCGPYLPHPDTPLGHAVGSGDQSIYSPDQVPASEEMGLKTIALARLVRPDANIPSTTAIATMDIENGRKKGLSRGANVIMPNLTPMKYRKMYEIYPKKVAGDETPDQTHEKAMEHLRFLGRPPGKGKGKREKGKGYEPRFAITDG